jgi:hypothetical protein
MQKEDWLKLLESEDKTEDWLWYSRYLRDEFNDDNTADAIKYILDNKLYPRYSRATSSWDWWNWKPEDCETCTINKDILDLLKNHRWPTYDTLSYREYETVFQAKLELIEAVKLYDSTILTERDFTHSDTDVLRGQAFKVDYEE